MANDIVSKYLANMASGAKTGASIGGTIGSVVPGVGTALGAVGGAAQGAGIANLGTTIGMIGGGGKNNSQGLPMFDPSQLALLNEINQRRKALMTGAGVQSGLSQVNQQTAQAQNLIAKNTGGDVGSTVSGLLQAQAVGGQNTNNVLAGAGQQQQYFTDLYNKLSNDISARKYGIQRYEYARQLAQEAEDAKNRNTNLGTTLGAGVDPSLANSLMGLINSGKAPDTTSIQSTQPMSLSQSISGNRDVPLSGLLMNPQYGSSMLSTIGQ